MRDFAYCTHGDDRGLFGTQVYLERVVSRTDAKQDAAGGEAPHGRWIGLLNVSRQGLVKLKAVLADLGTRPDFRPLDMPALLNALIADGAAIEVSYVHDPGEA